MNYLKGLVATLLLLASFSSYAQSGRVVQGILKDTLSRVVAGAKVELITDNDSTATSSSIGGIYTFNNFNGNTFKLKVSSIGFQPFEQSYTFPAGETKFMVPSIVLVGLPNMLEEVVINGVVTVQVKGDTLEYSTKDLKLREGSVAEDALKKLQGVEVDKDGNVTAQGEQVTRVRINGKDFFGGDVKTATQNLPANIIDKIKIVDDFGDMAALTGNKSGESTKVLDIQIDPQYNKGYMSTIRVGGGTEERYQATAMFMGLQDKTQVSVLGNLNNMNAPLFDFNAMGGGARGRQGGGGRPGGGGGMFGGAEGITNTGSIGVNIRHDFSETLKAYGSYSYGRDDNNTLTNSYMNRLAEKIEEYSDQNNDNIRANHRFEGNLEWNITPKDYIKITPQLGFGNNSADNLDAMRQLFDGTFSNYQKTLATNESTSPRYNFSGLYNRRLNDKGRNLFFNFNYDNAVTETEYNQELNRWLEDPNMASLPASDIFEKTLREVNNKSWNAGASVSYTEPLSEKSKIEVTYDFNNNDYDNHNKQELLPESYGSTGEGILNYDYKYDYAFTTHKVGASYMYDSEKVKYSLGAAVQPSLLKGNASSSSENASIDRSNLNIIPIARFEYKFSRQSNITLNYSGRSSEPSVSQVVPFDVATSQTYRSIGNPDLDPEFRHSMNLRYRTGDFQKGKTFFAMLRGELTNDKIVTYNETEIDSDLGAIRSVGYANESDPVYSLSSFYHWGQSFKDKTYNIMYGGGVNYNKNIAYQKSSFTNGEFQKNINNNTNIFQMLFFRYNPSENLEINPGLRYNYNITNSSLVDIDNRNTQKITPTLIGSVNITPTTIFGVDLSKEFNQGYTSNVNPFIINTYIEQRFLKGQRGTLRLQGFDLLDQQTNINRTVGEILTDSQTNRLARYFMLTFTFKLQKFSGINPFQNENRGPGGMRPPRM